MKKLDLYLNDDQYEKLSIMANEKNMDVEEYTNEELYDLIVKNWLKLKSEKLAEILADPNTDWEE